MSHGLRITADELRERMELGEEFTVIDVRNPQAWAEAKDKISGAIRVPLDDAERALPRIPRDKPIVTYCT